MAWTVETTGAAATRMTDTTQQLKLSVSIIGNTSKIINRITSKIISEDVVEVAVPVGGGRGASRVSPSTNMPTAE